MVGSGILIIDGQYARMGEVVYLADVAVTIEDLGDWSETITYLSTLDAKEWIMSYFIASKIMKRQPYQIEKEKHMTIKELLEMEIHDERVLDHRVPHCFRVVIRVPGGWIYETEMYKNDMYAGGVTSCFVPEPVCDQYVPDGVGVIEDIIMSSGSVEYDLKNSVVMNAIGCYIHNLLKESGSPNFITSSLGETKEVGTIESNRHKIYLTFGWANKKTPADVINELRKVIAEKRTYASLSVKELSDVLSSLRFPLWNEYPNHEAMAQAIMDKSMVAVADEYEWIKNYDLFKQSPEKFIEKLESVWDSDYGRMTVSKREDGKATVLELATGGWSENEEIILAMKMNYVFWSLYWVESSRGGYFKFEFPLN